MADTTIPTPAGIPFTSPFLTDMGDTVLNPMYDSDDDFGRQFEEAFDAQMSETLGLVTKMGYEQQIKDMQQQLDHHKKMSSELQHAALQAPPPAAPQPKAKRNYNVSEKSVTIRKHITANIGSQDYAQDLIAGVGLNNLQPDKIPRSLMRAYIRFRYEIDNKSS